MSALLQIRDVRKQFGGVAAVTSVSFEVNRGAFVGLIGPNGAGKTTLVNLISSQYPPSSGEILLESSPIQGLPPFRVARRGIARTYQQSRLFVEDSVVENLRAGLVFAGAGARPGLSYPGTTGGPGDRSDALLELFGLAKHRHAMPADLSYLLRRRLEIAQALALAPSLLLLDEPFAGFSHDEAAELVTLLRECQRGGLTVLLIDHNMEVVMKVCERIFVMHHGALLASGTPSEVRANHEVVSVYLGGEL